MQLLSNYKNSSAYQAGLKTLVDGLQADNEAKPLWQPIPNSPQERAYHSEADVIGFGGAAGGGKSYLILGFAFTQHKRSRIFRRTFKSLQGLIDDGDDLLDGRSNFVLGKGWRFDDKRIMAGYVEHEKQWTKWKGDRADFMAFDEADQFPEDLVDKLSGWNGTTDPHQRVRRVLCFNPPDLSGQWLVDYFGAWLQKDKHPDPAEDGELRYYIREQDEYIEIPETEIQTLTGTDLNRHLEETGKKGYYQDERRYRVVERNRLFMPVESRTFFKALVDDNPYAMATGYDRSLEMLPEPLRSQLRYGDFTIGHSDDIWQTIPSQWIRDAMERHGMLPKPKLKIRATGVDPSRGGKDEFCIANLRGNYFDEIIVHQGRTIPKRKGGQYGADITIAAVGTDNPDIAVDADGVGSSVYDALLDYEAYNTFPINNGSGGWGTDKSGKFPFLNLRAMIWWHFREALDPESGLYIALPPDDVLYRELRMPLYSTKTGKIQIEKKEDLAKRLGGSTNRADAVIYAWFMATNYRKRGTVRLL